MSENININQILFLDIETVPQYQSYENLSDKAKTLWNKKAQKLSQSESDTAEKIYQKAGIYAEFGKVICIAVGFMHEDKFRVKAFYGNDEKKLLEEFAVMLENFQKRPNAMLCAHNGKEFDFPYLCRRLLINRIDIPKTLNVIGKKPWETSFIDTMDLWRFGDYKSYTSIDLLTTIFDIPTPKDEIDGSMVADYYWNRKDLDTIVKYCRKDVVAVVQLYLRLHNKELVDESNIEFVE